MLRCLSYKFCSTLDSVCVFLLFKPHDLPYSIEAFLKLRIFREVPYLHLDYFDEWFPDLQFFQQAKRPAKNKPCKISCLHVRWDYTIAQHERETSGMIRNGINALNRHHDPLEFFNGRSNGIRNFLP